VRYLESRLLAEAGQVGRITLEQNQAGGSKLPESDRADMEVFLSHIRQLLPVLGSDILAPIAQPTSKSQSGGMLFCRLKGAEARGYRTPNGFAVFRDSTAVLEDRPSAQSYPNVLNQRKELIANGTLMSQTSDYRGPIQAPEKETIWWDLFDFFAVPTADFLSSCSNRR
jgi:hypothetical protein